jgi:8-oxo-dGTP pyrophosphatase MutT (NUDIX family)
MPAPPHIRVLAAVIVRDGRWLLCRRPPHKRHGGRWEFPGGKLENGESLHDAARRELMEELGVAVSAVGDVVYRRADPESPYLIEFTTIRIVGQPEPLEHTELLWCAPADSVRLPLAPADGDFVQSVLDGTTRLK